MIVLHHLENSRSHRVLWLLEELGLTYEIVPHKRNPKTFRAPPELLAIHPLGRAPIIVDDGRVVAESGAIIQYLIEVHAEGRLAVPPDAPNYRDYQYWIHYAEGSAMPPLLVKFIAMRIPGAVPFFIRPIAHVISDALQKSYTDPEIALHQNFWERRLAEREWFAGSEFTAADIQMSYPVEVSLMRAGSEGAFPAIQRFIERIRQRPAYQRAITVGGGLSTLD